MDSATHRDAGGPAPAPAVLVCVKQVGVLSDEVELIDDDRRVDPDYLDFALNEWDAYAVEAALALKEGGFAGHVVAATVGSGELEAEAAVRRALAMGCDEAVRVELDSDDPLRVAAELADIARAAGAALVLCGAQSADLANAAVGGAIAGLLDWPYVALACRLEADGGELRVARELDGRVVERLSVAPPLVVSVQSGINEPRYVSFGQIKAADAAEVRVVASATDEADSPWRLAVPDGADGTARVTGAPEELAERIVALVGGAR